MAKVLGARLGALVAAHPQVARQAHAAARQAVASFQRESAVARTDFSRPYEEPSMRDRSAKSRFW